MKELWHFFNKKGQVVDIILPRRSDKFNKRYGFVKVRQEKDVADLIQSLKYKAFYSQPLVMKQAKQKGPSGNGKREGEINKPEESFKNPEACNHSTPSIPVLGEAKEIKVPVGNLEEKEEVVNISPCPDIESIASRSTVCFSDFPLNGDILQEIIIELGYKDIVVKELSCYKFILSFKSKKLRDDFKFENLVDWVALPRPMEKEDFRVNRKTLLEIRGLPCNAWKEENLKKIVRNFGTWGWWINNPMYHSSLENPRVVIYTEQLKKIKELIKVQLKEDTRKVLIYEVETINPIPEESNIERDTGIHRKGKEKRSLMLAVPQANAKIVQRTKGVVKIVPPEQKDRLSSTGSAEDSLGRTSRISESKDL